VRMRANYQALYGQTVRTNHGAETTTYGRIKAKLRMLQYIRASETARLAISQLPAHWAY